MDGVKTRAFCSPGRRHDATWALAVNGQSVDRLSETPILEGGTVVVARDVPLPMPEVPMFTPALPPRSFALFWSLTGI